MTFLRRYPSDLPVARGLTNAALSLLRQKTTLAHPYTKGSSLWGTPKTGLSNQKAKNNALASR
ncbi:hypothetical protein H6G97_08785 [Nostoc flagelliforme FACHB-838]|uniref:Transposase n=1 Tax=Nostoc flagelliforme FACHB-838 TaxID=2692904 RepID=A0ABR8DL91_9NOSO|nr:hypothetical protein [Nostoc flagelliforme]MBD2529655.1 hypothetical protein [Nostoc flagelliforme FACHB-838]